MNIKINIVELATDLAHTYLEENHRDDCSIDGELTKTENGVEVYNEEAQQTFDWLYDDYYNHLMKFKTESVHEDDERVSMSAFNEVASLAPQRCVDTTLALVMNILMINQESGEMTEAQVKRVYEYIAQMLYPKNEG